MNREYNPEKEEEMSYYTELNFSSDMCSGSQETNEFYMDTFRILHQMVEEDKLKVHKTYPQLCHENQCFLFDKKVTGYLEKVLYGIKGRRHTNIDRRSMKNMGKFKYQEGLSQVDLNLLVRCVKVNDRLLLNDEMKLYSQYILVHVFKDTHNYQSQRTIKKKIIKQVQDSYPISPKYKSPSLVDSETEQNILSKYSFEPQINQSKSYSTIKFLNQRVIDLEESLIKSEIEKKNLEIFLLQQKQSELNQFKKQIQYDNEVEKPFNSNHHIKQEFQDRDTQSKND